MPGEQGDERQQQRNRDTGQRRSHPLSSPCDQLRDMAGGYAQARGSEENNGEQRREQHARFQLDERIEEQGPCPEKYQRPGVIPRSRTAAENRQEQCKKEQGREQHPGKALGRVPHVGGPPRGEAGQALDHAVVLHLRPRPAIGLPSRRMRVQHLDMIPSEVAAFLHQSRLVP